MRRFAPEDRLVWSVLAALALALAVIFTPSDRSKLEYWTAYYSFRTADPVAEVGFSSDGDCANVARLNSQDFKLTYSTSAWCSWETERTRARRALCVIHMGKPDGSSRPRDVEECMRWYDN